MAERDTAAQLAEMATRGERLGEILARAIPDERAAPAWELIAKADRILLLAHEKPDPDALGSALGLAFALAPLGKRCVVACADPVPPTTPSCRAARPSSQSYPTKTSTW